MRFDTTPVWEAESIVPLNTDSETVTLAKSIFPALLTSKKEAVLNSEELIRRFVMLNVGPETVLTKKLEEFIKHPSIKDSLKDTAEFSKET